MEKLNWVLLASVILWGTGCGASGPERIGLSGKVNYNGVPVEDGEIALFPDKGVDAPPTSAPILRGSYWFNPQFALRPGTYSVAIRSYKVPEKGSKPAEVADPAAYSSGIVIKEQLLPEQFNTKSTLEKITVKSGERAIVRDYNLRD